ncbi:MAG: response regulator [Deltaproteobacteria bacterium]|nr:response regulator [Deltaproteobacteria bacterium]
METKKKVLIVDDEVDMLELLSPRLQAIGKYIVETATDGAMGLQKVGEFNPDIVLLDVVMPKMDGWEVCRSIRSSLATKNIPVILITAAQAIDLEKKAKEVGANKVLVRPYKEQELFRIMQDLLD